MKVGCCVDCWNCCCRANIEHGGFYREEGRQMKGWDKERGCRGVGNGWTGGRVWGRREEGWEGEEGGRKKR